MKKVLFISYDGMTDPLGQSQVIPYLTGLTKFGYRFTILSCEKPGRYRQLKKEVADKLKNYPIQWVPLLYHKTPPVFATIYDVVALKKKARMLQKAEPFDMVHTRPGIPALIGLWMKNQFGTRFLNDIREFYADSRVDAGLWKQENFMYRAIYRYFKKKEEQAVIQNDGIVCLTHAAEQIIKDWPQYKTSIPVEVIPCSVDLTLFDPLKYPESQKQEVRAELALSGDDMIFSYLGSIGSWYLTDELMQFFRAVSDRISNSKFLFISPDQHTTIIDAAKKAGLSESRIRIKNARRNEVPVLLSLSTYSAFFIRSCYSKLSSSPTKHGEIMAMGIPVITNSGVGDIREIVERFHSGIVLDKLDEKQLDHVAESIAEGMDFPRSLIRAGAESTYDLEAAINKYGRLYDAILK